MPYDKPNTLRFEMAHMLRTIWKLDPADVQGLFEPASLDYWWRSGKSADDILRATVGPPNPKRTSLWGKSA
jgi:hypothetical protein